MTPTFSNVMDGCCVHLRPFAVTQTLIYQQKQGWYGALCRAPNSAWKVAAASFGIICMISAKLTIPLPLPHGAFAAAPFNICLMCFRSIACSLALPNVEIFLQ